MATGGAQGGTVRLIMFVQGHLAAAGIATTLVAEIMMLAPGSACSPQIKLLTVLIPINYART